MKIAMIGHKRIPGREGGIEVVVEEISKEMVKLGHSVTVYNRKTSKIKSTVRKFDGIRIITVPTIEKKSTDAIVYSFLASIHSLFCHYDVIHYHALGPSVMLLIPHIFGKKTIVTVHGLNYKTPKWKGLGAKVILLGEKITAKYADQIIVLSKEQQNYFKNKYNRDTIYIPNGVSLCKILKPNIITKKWNLKQNEYILFLSRVVPGKGLEYLIDAYKRLDTNIPLIVAGSSVYADDFYKMIEYKVGNDTRIRFIGFVEGEQIAELYSNAKIFVFPSEAEGMPMCLLEALSYNTTCLVSDIPENVEVGRDYVYTFESKNADDLYDKLNNLLKNDAIKQNSRDYVSNQYNWGNVVKKTIEAYRR